jgi:hypothetical protein
VGVDGSNRDLIAAALCGIKTAISAQQCCLEINAPIVATALLNPCGFARKARFQDGNSNAQTCYGDSGELN